MLHSAYSASELKYLPILLVALEADPTRHMELFPEEYTAAALQQQSGPGARSLNMVSADCLTA